jgi:hypothetical protein
MTRIDWRLRCKLVRKFIKTSPLGGFSSAPKIALTIALGALSPPHLRFRWWRSKSARTYRNLFSRCWLPFHAPAKMDSGCIPARTKPQVIPPTSMVASFTSPPQVSGVLHPSLWQFPAPSSTLSPAVPLHWLDRGTSPTLASMTYSCRLYGFRQ